MANLRELVIDGVTGEQSWKTQLLFPIFLPFIEKVFQSEWVRPLKVANKYTNQDALTYMTDYFMRAHILLIAPEYLSGDTVKEKVKEPNGGMGDLDLNAPLDLPFEVCYFEYPDDNYHVQVIDQSVVEETAQIYLKAIELTFILAIELPDRSCAIFSYGFERNQTTEAPRFYTYIEADTGDPTTKKHLWLKSAVVQILKSLNKSSAATEKVNFRQKIRINGENIHHKIKEITHIVPSKKYAIKRVSTISEIDWSHRWEVRGHWRKITGALGKDRYGHYTVSGYTWVNPHERGPDDKPLVKKIRVVKGEDGIGSNT